MAVPKKKRSSAINTRRQLHKAKQIQKTKHSRFKIKQQIKQLMRILKVKLCV